jgi:hypothetical protein
MLTRFVVAFIAESPHRRTGMDAKQIEEVNQLVSDILEKDDVFSDVTILEEDDLLTEMAMTLRPEETGLPVNIWISTKESAGKEISHAARLKAMSTHDQKTKASLTYAVTLHPPYTIYNKNKVRIDVKDFKKVKEWIKANRDALMLYWEDEIRVTEFLEMLKKGKLES